MLPLRKGEGAENVLAMLEGEQNKFWGSFSAEASSLSHSDGGPKKVSAL